MAFKLRNIKDVMSRKYGTGEYARGGKKFEQRMKPGESKFNYDVRMRKEGYRAKQREPGVLEREIADKSDLTKEQRLALGEKLYPETNPNDLTDKSQVENYGIIPDMNFQQAFAQAGKMGATKNSPPFEWFNPKSQRIEQFIYELKK